MIASQVKGSGFRGCLDYLLDEDKSAEIIGGNMVGESARELAAEFGIMRAMRPSLGNAVHHVSLSSSPGDPKLTDDDWNNVADRYMKKMGFGKSQYIMIRHHDTDHQHAHIVANRVDMNGEAVSDSHEYRRSAKAIQDIEREFGLQPSAMTPSQARRKKKQKSPGRGEFQMMAATKKPSNRLQLQALVDVAAKRNPTMSQFISRLHCTGVGVMPHIQSTGRVQGISFEINGAAFKGSSLGKAYSFNGLQKKLGVSYDKKRDFKALEEAVSGGKKKEFLRMVHIEREHKELGQALSTTKKERDDAVDEVKEKVAEIGDLQTANAESQKLLKAAGKTNKKLQNLVDEQDKKLKKADPEALKKAQEALAAAGKTNKQLQEDLTEKNAQLEKADPVALKKALKDNALLREALDNYKQADLERDQGKGHEKG